MPTIEVDEKFRASLSIKRRESVDKVAAAAKARLWRKENPERAAANRKAYEEKNRERLNAYARNRRAAMSAAGREKVSKSRKVAYDKNAPKLRVIARENYYRNHDARRAHASEYRNSFDGKAFLLMSSTMRRAYTKKIDFNITTEWLDKKLHGSCEATGLPFVFGEPNSPWLPSIDRIDASGGYTMDNCRVVVKLFNLGRNMYSDDDFERLAAAYLSSRKRVVSLRKKQVVLN